MDAATALVEIEAIKCLKARYCRLLDRKDWPAWRQLFTDDFSSDTLQSGGRVIEGGDEFVAFVESTLGKKSRITVHHVHMPEISMISDSVAEGVWALEDIVRLAPGFNMRGFGHYIETYIKVGGEWKIKASRLTRTRMDIFNLLFSIYLPSWLYLRSRK
jgi:hypothetical protein